MKNAIITAIVIGLMSMILNCNEKSNPSAPIINNQDSSLIDSVKVKVIVKDTIQIGIDHQWMVLINKPELVDKITETDSGEGKMVSVYLTPKNEISDTVLWTSSNSYEETAKVKIEWFVGNQSRDTEITTYVVDTIPVDVQSGSFAPISLTEGDSLKLFVLTNPFTHVPYTCQWYKDGQKIGDPIQTEYATTVSYKKANITMADSGSYAIEIYRAHSDITYDQMHVTINKKQ